MVSFLRADMAGPSKSVDPAASPFTSFVSTQGSGGAYRFSPSELAPSMSPRDSTVPPVYPRRDPMAPPVSSPRALMAPLVSFPCDPMAFTVSPARDPIAPPVSPRDPVEPSVSPSLDSMTPPVSSRRDPCFPRDPMAPPGSLPCDPMTSPVSPLVSLLGVRWRPCIFVLRRRLLLQLQLLYFELQSTFSPRSSSPTPLLPVLSGPSVHCTA